VTAEPASVEVEGPRSAVEATTAAITEAVSAEGAAGPITELVTVGVADPTVRLTSTAPVRVTVNVAPAQVQWAVAGIRVTVRNGSGREAVTPGAVTVHVRGPRDAMVAADAAAFDATVDVDGLRPGEYQLPVRVGLPPRIGITRVDPAEVRVRIR
jgi:hypothetical protein